MMFSHVVGVFVCCQQYQFAGALLFCLGATARVVATILRSMIIVSHLIHFLCPFVLDFAFLFAAAMSIVHPFGARVSLRSLMLPVLQFILYYCSIVVLNSPH